MTCAVNERSSGSDSTPKRPRPSDQPVQDVDRRPRVGQGPVVRRRGRGEEGGQRAQLAVGHLVPGQHPTGEHRGVDHGEVGPGLVAGVAGRPQEADVERGVVRDEHAAAGEFEERRQHASAR